MARKDDSATPPDLADTEDQTASIDVAVTFFACIVAVFAFVTFTLAPSLPPQTDESLGQVRASVTVSPPIWSPVTERTSFLFFDGTYLVKLQFDEIWRESVLQFDQASDESGYFSFRYGTGMSPNEFIMTSGFNPDVLAEPWRGPRIDFTAIEKPCLPDLRPTLTVWVSREAEHLSPLITWAKRCRHTLRPVVIRGPEESGNFTRAIALTPAQFSSEARFR